MEKLRFLYASFYSTNAFWKLSFNHYQGKFGAVYILYIILSLQAGSNFLFADPGWKGFEKNRLRSSWLETKDLHKSLVIANQPEPLFVSNFRIIGLTLLWLITRSASVEVHKSIFLWSWPIFKVLQCYDGTGQYLLPSGLDDASYHSCNSRSRAVLCHLRSVLGVCKFTDCLGPFGPKSSVDHFPMPLGLAHF